MGRFLLPRYEVSPSRTGPRPTSTPSSLASKLADEPQHFAAHSRGAIRCRTSAKCLVDQFGVRETYRFIDPRVALNCL